MEILGYLFSILIGISLGLIGSGGSILTIPLLVYIFKINPELSTTYSLFVVGLVAFFGSVQHFRLGNLQLKSAIVFAIPSVFAIFIMKNYIMPNVSNEFFLFEYISITKNFLIMILFSILMIFASFAMIKKSNFVEENSKINNFKLISIGFLVGIITGFLGIGGGFLIIPALLFFAKLPFKQAVGTSLLIVFINSIIGFSVDVVNQVAIDYLLLFKITIIAIVGMFIGTELSKKMNSEKLKPIFGWFILFIGIFIISKEILKF